VGHFAGFIMGCTFGTAILRVRHNVTLCAHIESEFTKNQDRGYVGDNRRCDFCFFYYFCHLLEHFLREQNDSKVLSFLNAMINCEWSSLRPNKHRTISSTQLGASDDCVAVAPCLVKRAITSLSSAFLGAPD
jgi:hypothetical protein